MRRRAPEPGLNVRCRLESRFALVQLEEAILNNFLSAMDVPEEVERDPIQHRLMRVNDRVEILSRNRHSRF